MTEDQISKSILDAAFRVHKNLGLGLLETTYELCLLHLLVEKGLKVARQKPLPVIFEGVLLEGGYRLELLVEEKVIIEVKAVDAIHPLHEAQLLTYLKLSGIRLGLLINFNVKLLKEGIRRRVI